MNKQTKLAQKKANIVLLDKFGPYTTTSDQIAKMIGVKKATIYGWRQGNTIPRGMIILIEILI